MQTSYKVQLEKINTTFDAAVTNLQSQYLRSLASLEKSFQVKGSLDALIAVRKERDRFGAALKIEEANLSSYFPELGRAQTDFMKAGEGLSLKKAMDIIALAEQYKKSLISLQEKLTKAGDIAAAMEVKMEGEAVSERPEVSASRSAVADADAKKKTSQPPSSVETHRPPPSSVSRTGPNAEPRIRERFSDLCKALENQESDAALAAYADPSFIQKRGSKSVKKYIISVCPPLKFVAMKADLKVSAGTVKVGKKGSTATLVPRIELKGRLHDMDTVSWLLVDDDWFLDMTNSSEADPPSMLVIPHHK